MATDFVEAVDVVCEIDAAWIRQGGRVPVAKFWREGPSRCARERASWRTDRFERDLRLDTFLASLTPEERGQNASGLRVRRTHSDRVATLEVQHRHPQVGYHDVTLGEMADAYRVTYPALDLTFRYASGWTRHAYLEPIAYAYLRWFGHRLDALFPDLVVVR